LRLPPIVLIGLNLVLSSCTKADTDTALREWKIGAAPTLTIGGDGSPQTEFTRVTGAWRLSNGATAVVDAGSNVIRMFAASGALAQRFGRSGDGPGEFRNMVWTGRFGDTAVVYDGALRRITTILLTDHPRLLATLLITANDDRAGDGVSIVGRLADGRWLVRAMGRPDPNRFGVQRVPGFAGLIRSTGTGSIQWVAEAPDLSIVVSATGNQKLGTVEITAFPASLATAASGSAIWFGDTAADTIVRVDAATGTRQKVTLPDPPAALPRELIDAARARALAEARDQAERERVATTYSAPNLPTHLPAFEALVPGAGGEVWVETPAGGRATEKRYVVLSPSGSPIARVSVAAGFRVTEVGRDHVVGVYRDDDGIESVRVYALTR